VSDGGQVRKGGSHEDTEHDPAAQDHAPQAESAEDTKELLDDVDELLDEIDDVLEENAEEFVRSYVQKGGQ
jgi:prokaryotic ubiquitin-like protein Pup